MIIQPISYQVMVQQDTNFNSLLNNTRIYRYTLHSCYIGAVVQDLDDYLII